MYKIVVFCLIIGYAAACKSWGGSPCVSGGYVDRDSITGAGCRHTGIDIQSKGKDPSFYSRVGEDEGEKEYKVYDLPEHELSYVEAMRFCWKEGGNLAAVKTPEITEKINTMLRGSHADGEHFWIGGSDALSEGKWVWSSDLSPMEYEGNWLAGKPNHEENNTDDCMEAVLDKGKLFFSDVKCEKKHKFVCEKPTAA